MFKLRCGGGTLAQGRRCWRVLEVRRTGVTLAQSRRCRRVFEVGRRATAAADDPVREYSRCGAQASLWHGVEDVGEWLWWGAALQRQPMIPSSNVGRSLRPRSSAL